MGEQDETREQPTDGSDVDAHGHLSPLGGGKNIQSEGRDDEDDDVEGHGQHLSPLGGGKN